MSKYRNLKRLAITCGGTGGHFFPGLTIARYFQGHNGKVLVLLGGKKLDDQAETVLGHNLKVKKLKPMPPPRLFMPFLRFIYGTIHGTIVSIRTLKKFRPDALLAMGSFASLPPVLAAKILGIPIFLHDGNARVGKANRFFSPWARLMGTAFPAVNGDKIKCPHEYVGMPVRPELDYRPVEKTKAIDKINSLFELDFKADVPTLLIFGGSQGAQIFNEVFPKMMLESGRTDFQVLHLTGENKFESTKALYDNAKFPVLCLPGTSGMHWFYQAADAVVCRSGGSTLAELCLFGKFAFLIPYPYASERHQDDNARFMVSTGAAEMIDNSECNVEKAREILDKWLSDPHGYVRLGDEARKSAKADATSEMIRLMDNLVQQQF